LGSIDWNKVIGAEIV